MSEIFATATVRIVPSLAGFVTDLREQLTAVMAKINEKPPVIRVRPGLSPDFIGSLRTQVNEAVLQAQTKVKPIIIQSVVTPPTKAELAALSAKTPVVTQAAAAAPVGIPVKGQGVVPIAPPTQGPFANEAAGAATKTQALTAANRQLVKSQELVALAQLRVDEAFKTNIGIQEQVAAVTAVTTNLDKAQAAAEESLIKATVAKDVAAKKAAESQLAQIGSLKTLVAPRVTAVETATQQAAAEKEATRVAEQEAAKQAKAAEKAAAAEAAAAEKAAAQQAAAAEKAAAAQIKAQEKVEAAQTASLRRLAAANEAGQRKLAAVSVAAAPGATPVQAARAEFRAAQRADVFATTNLNKALEFESANETAAAEAAVLEASALKRATLAKVAATEESLALAVAEQKQGSAAAASAVKQEELRRGGFATLLSRLGIRGATLAASAPFLAGAAAVTIFAKSIKEASSEQEALARVEKVLGGDVSRQLEERAKGMASSFGLSATEALRAEGAFAELFHNVGISNQRAGQFSEQLTKLASDMSAFNNIPIDATLRALQLGIAGNTRSLKQFGIILTQADVNQEALNATGKKFTTQLSRQELALARYRLILKDTANQQGAFADRSGSLAGQSRILRANITNLADSIGQVLTPALTGLLTVLNQDITAFEKAQKAAHGFIEETLRKTGASQPGASRFATFLTGSVVAQAKQFVHDTGDMIKAQKAFGESLTASGRDAQRAADAAASTQKALADAVSRSGKEAVNSATEWRTYFEIILAGLFQVGPQIQLHIANIIALKETLRGLSGLEVQQLKIQTGLAPGGRAAEEANLRQQIAGDKKAIAESKSGSAKRKELLGELKADQDALAALIQQDATDAKNTAQKIKDAQSKKDQAGQDVADSILQGRRATILQRAITNAGLSSQLTDDINTNKAWLAFLKKQKEVILARLKAIGVSKSVIVSVMKQISDLIFSTTNELKNLAKQQAENLKQQRDALEAIVMEKLDLRIQIAEAGVTSTNANTAALLRAHTAKLKEIERQLVIARKQYGKNSVEWLRLRAAEAEEIKAINDLKQTTQVDNKAKQDLFSILTQAQGFSTNLLGNLIGLSVSGLVGLPPAGGGGGGGTGGGGGGGGRGGLLIPSVRDSGDAVAARLRRGAAAGVPSLPGGGGPASELAKASNVSRAQGDTLIFLQRQILRTLNEIAKGLGHPQTDHHRNKTRAKNITVHGD